MAWRQGVWLDKIQGVIKSPVMGLVFNWLALSFLAASTSALVENKHMHHHHLLHYAPFARTTLMVLESHSAGSVAGSSTTSSATDSTMRTSEHSRFGAL